MMWVLLLAIGVLLFIAAVILAVLAVRRPSARIAEDIAAPRAEGSSPATPTRDIALFVVAAVFLLQACCILVAYVVSRMQFGANPWG